MTLMQEQLDKALKEHKSIVEIYKKKYANKDKRDWRTYEQRLALRIKKVSEEIEPVVEKAYSMIEVSKTSRGRPPKIPVTKKVMILLLKDIFQLSNRKMANFLAFFTALTGIDMSYKSVERIYSDDLARLIIHNMFLILVQKKGIKKPDTSGDGTGYSLTITKHYRKEREKEFKKNNKTKNKNNTKRKSFARAFALMDLDTGMYIGYGTSMKSEKEAFRKAVNMMKRIGISANSTRLDKYYSHQSIPDEFDPETTIYIIPKKNATIKGSSSWKQIITRFVEDPIFHLREYYKRNNSESGFSADKRMCGWKIWQRKDDRIDTALMCKGVWHNLMLID